MSVNKQLSNYIFYKHLQTIKNALLLFYFLKFNLIFIINKILTDITNNNELYYILN